MQQSRLHVKDVYLFIYVFIYDDQNPDSAQGHTQRIHTVIISQGQIQSIVKVTETGRSQGIIRNGANPKHGKTTSKT